MHWHNYGNFGSANYKLFKENYITLKVVQCKIYFNDRFRLKFIISYHRVILSKKRINQLMQIGILYFESVLCIIR